MLILSGPTRPLCKGLFLDPVEFLTGLNGENKN